MNYFFISLKWIIVGCSIVGITSCSFFAEEEEVEPLLSKIDGEKYYATLEGEMTLEKAFILIDQDSLLSIPNELFIQMMKNLVDDDSSFRAKNFEYLTKINFEITHQFPIEIHTVLQSLWFTKLIKHPRETIFQLQSLGNEEYEFWLSHLRKGYQTQLLEEGVTKISVINLMIQNCVDCSLTTQEDIESFVEFLELE